MADIQSRRVEQTKENMVKSLHVRRQRAEDTISRLDALSTSKGDHKALLLTLASQRRAQAMVSASTFGEEVSTAFRTPSLKPQHIKVSSDSQQGNKAAARTKKKSRLTSSKSRRVRLSGLAPALNVTKISSFHHFTHGSVPACVCVCCCCCRGIAWYAFHALILMRGLLYY